VCLGAASDDAGDVSLRVCRHVYHATCVDTWFAHCDAIEASRTCPTCRAVVRRGAFDAMCELATTILGIDAAVAIRDDPVAMADAMIHAFEQRRALRTEAVVSARLADH